MFIRILFVTTFLTFMSASYAAPADRLLSPFDNLHLIFRARTPTFGVNLRGRTSVPLSDFPVQCQQGCAPAIDAINTCTSGSCVCVPTVDSSLAYCVSCSVNTNPTPSNIQSGQQLLDTYNNLCRGAGVSSIGFTITNTAPAPTPAVPPATSTSVTALKPISTTTGNAIPTPALGPTTTISGLPQTGTSTITSTSSTASSQRNNAPVIRPHAAFTSIGLAMVLSIVIL